MDKKTMLQPPTLQSFSDMPVFNTKAVVHQTAVPAPTLRAWERRYGILSPRRGDNDYRLYSERDIAIINWLRERVQSGMTISQAITLLKSLESGYLLDTGTPRTNPPQRDGHQAAVSSSTLTASTMLAATEPPSQTPTHSLKGFALDQVRAQLLRQIASVDEQAATRSLAHSLAMYSVEDVCLEILTPVLHDMGQRETTEDLSSTTVHFGATLVRAQLDSLFRSASASQGDPLVFVGCAPGELHELGPLMLALFLRRGGFHVVFLGQDVDEHGVVAAVREFQPAAILLSASQPAAAERSIALGRDLRERSGVAPLFVVGGQAFEQRPELVSQVSGVFLGADARDAVRELRKRLST